MLCSESLSSNTFYRYNWFWLAAFCAVAVRFAKEAHDTLSMGQLEADLDAAAAEPEFAGK